VLVAWGDYGCISTTVARGLAPGLIPVIWNIRQTVYSLSTLKMGSAAVLLSLVPLGPLASAVVYNSVLAAEQHERLGYPASKRVVILNGFDLARWHPRERTASGVISIGRFGRYVPMKDFDTFLEAARIIREAEPRARFILAGSNVTSANAGFVANVARLGLTEHVALLGERDDMELLTSSLDIAVSSSAFDEGFPNVVGEAMASGVPVVATNIGDTSTLVGDAGASVPPRSPEAIAAACLDIIHMTS